MPEELVLLRALLLSNPWLAMPIWVVICLSDYYLTIYGSRLYQESGKQYIFYEEGYELTPAFQKDVDSLHLFSSRLFKVIASSLILLFFIWLASVRLFDIPEFYFIIVGSFILPQVVIHVRHVRKICLFRITASQDRPGITGSLTYPKWVSLRLDAVEFFSFAVLFLLLAIMFENWFFLGGALSSFMEGVKSYNLSSKREPLNQNQ